MSLSIFIKRYPVFTYFVLTFAVSWTGFLLVLGPGSFPGTQQKFETVFPLAIILMLTGPAIAGLLLTGLAAGRAGLRELFSRFLKWRVGARWYAAALLPAPLMVAAVLFALSQTCPLFTAENKVVILLTGIAAGLTTILEEIGWTGFAVPRMRQRYSILTTGLIVGVLWGVWHFLQVLWISGVYSGTIPLPFFFAQYFLFSIAQLTAYRILLVWIFDRTGSLLLTTLMHLSYTASTTIILRPLETGASFLIFGWVFAVVLWIFVAAVAAANGNLFMKEG
ncbi:MAG: CPBP family intramembrane metalloprotease [Candidatus Margulisbacteria bacterium]|nr:CPBP family intramembrane metalloprotease [Candidatus Margulisiibacteriota bacterium]